MRNPQPLRQPNRITAWIVYPVSLLILYLLSSGPIIATGFWLRQSTGYDQFYAVMLPYYPLLRMGHGNLFDAYIEWWVVDVFHTVGPG